MSLRNFHSVSLSLIDKQLRVFIITAHTYILTGEKLLDESLIVYCLMTKMVFFLAWANWKWLDKIFTENRAEFSDSKNIWISFWWPEISDLFEKLAPPIITFWLISQKRHFIRKRTSHFLNQKNKLNFFRNFHPIIFSFYVKYQTLFCIKIYTRNIFRKEKIEFKTKNKKKSFM